MKKLLNIAYSELQKLEEKTPTWETFEQIAIMASCVDFFERSIRFESNTLTETIDEMREVYGDSKTLDIITRILADFKSDMDCISPYLANTLINKLKEGNK